MPDNDERILLIRTGGTIDSKVYPKPYTLRKPPGVVETLKGNESLIMRTVAKLSNHELVDGFSWVNWANQFAAQEAASIEDKFVKDSSLFTPEDIHALAQIIKDDNIHHHFVITHGTDAMAKNARDLQKELKGSDKVVVFTGAMVPLSMRHQRKSDAIPALQYTLDNIRDQDSGVYIVGRRQHSQRLDFFDPVKVEKDRTQSRDKLRFTLMKKPPAR